LQSDSVLEVYDVGELIKYYVLGDISSDVNPDNSTNNATFNRAIRFIDNNNLEATLFAGTKISTKSGNSFDLLALELVENSGDDIDLESYETLV
jgi:hypothetical protein